MLKFTFVIHIIIGLIFGIGLYVVPDMFYGFFGMAFIDPLGRAFGAIMLALTIGSVLALFTRDWARVRILVELEIFWCILGLIAILVHMFLPPLLTLTAGLVAGASLAVLLFLFLISYFIQRRD